MFLETKYFSAEAEELHTGEKQTIIFEEKDIRTFSNGFGRYVYIYRNETYEYPDEWVLKSEPIPIN